METTNASDLQIIGDRKVQLSGTVEGEIASLKSVLRHADAREIQSPSHLLWVFGWRSIYFQSVRKEPVPRLLEKQHSLLTLGKPLFNVEPVDALERLSVEKRDELTGISDDLTTTKHISEKGRTRVPTLLAYMGTPVRRNIDLVLYPEGVTGIDYLLRPISQSHASPHESLNGQGIFEREEITAVQGLYQALSNTSARLLDEANL